MFKIGDKVRCIDSTARFGDVCLTRNKIYEVKDVNGVEITIEDDGGEKLGYFKDRFELLKVHPIIQVFMDMHDLELYEEFGLNGAKLKYRCTEKTIEALFEEWEETTSRFKGILKAKVTKLTKTHTIVIDGEEQTISHEKYLFLTEEK